jgi:hypothetical protein
MAGQAMSDFELELSPGERWAAEMKEQHRAYRAEIDAWIKIAKMYNADADAANAAKLRLAERVIQLEEELRLLRLERDKDNVSYQRARDAITFAVETALDIERKRVAALERLACFLKSVVQSGEDWTDTCEAEFRALFPLKLGSMTVVVDQPDGGDSFILGEARGHEFCAVCSTSRPKCVVLRAKQERCCKHCTHGTTTPVDREGV